MTKQEQDKLWNDLSNEKKKEYRKEFQQESKSYNINLKHCDEENGFEYRTGYSNGVISTLEDLFGSHNLQPKLTYEDVENELIKLGKGFPLAVAGETNLQGKKLIAINKLLNVAKFLNKNEDGTLVPDFKDSNQEKWYIFIDRDGDVHVDEELDGLNSRIVYFRTEALAKQAVEILGEEVIRTALGNY